MIKRLFIGFAAVVAISLIAGAFVAGAFSSEGSSDPRRDPGMTRTLAPIEAARIEPANIGGSYAVAGTAGLPGGCAVADGFEVTQDGTNITVKVHNLVPADSRICTAIYGMYPIAIGLGTDLEAGVEYTVDVNGTILTFVA
jgi:hypothetical protein